ncbi:MAG: hypothetical protein HXX18_03340 [Bacteroidetes bacterium]|nr:hypothetical protein [Bacteroidota bacterium]
MNHLKCVLFFNEGYSGEIKENEFKIWNYCHFWGRVFYAVIHGKVTFQNSKQKVILKTKMNIIGRCISIIILGFLVYGAITGIILQQDNSWTFLWKRIIAALVFVSPLIIAIRLIYRLERNIQIGKLKEIIKKCDEFS